MLSSVAYKIVNYFQLSYASLFFESASAIPVALTAGQDLAQIKPIQDK